MRFGLLRTVPLLSLLGCHGSAAPSAAAPAVPPRSAMLATTTPNLDAHPEFRASVDRWLVPMPPFRVIDNVYYVGSATLGAYLVATPQGLILLDGGLAESPPLIIASIAALGFDIRNVRILLNSHAHFDHSGGLAALKAASGAQFVASAADRPFLESGHIGWGPAANFDTNPVTVDRVIADGGTVSLGGVTLTAMITPGHTPGCTSWTMTAHDSRGVPRRVFFLCSTSVGGQSVAPESYPGMVADYRRSFDRLARVQADVFLSNHGEVFQLAERRQRQLAGEPDAFVDPGALHAAIEGSRQAFEQELARQAAGGRP